MTPPPANPTTPSRPPFLQETLHLIRWIYYDPQEVRQRIHLLAPDMPWEFSLWQLGIRRLRHNHPLRRCLAQLLLAIPITSIPAILLATGILSGIRALIGVPSAWNEHPFFVFWVAIIVLCSITFGLVYAALFRLASGLLLSIRLGIGTGVMGSFLLLGAVMRQFTLMFEILAYRNFDLAFQTQEGVQLVITIIAFPTVVSLIIAWIWGTAAIILELLEGLSALGELLATGIITIVLMLLAGGIPLARAFMALDVSCDFIRYEILNPLRLGHSFSLTGCLQDIAITSGRIWAEHLFGDVVICVTAIILTQISLVIQRRFGLG